MNGFTCIRIVHTVLTLSVTRNVHRFKTKEQADIPIFYFGVDYLRRRKVRASLTSTTEAVTVTFIHPQNVTPPTDLTGYYAWSPKLTDWA